MTYQHAQEVTMTTLGILAHTGPRSRSSRPTPNAVKLIKKTLAECTSTDKLICMMVAIPISRTLGDDAVVIPRIESQPWSKDDYAEEPCYILPCLILPEDYQHCAGYVPPERAHAKILQETIKVIPYPLLYSYYNYGADNIVDTVLEDCVGLKKIELPLSNMLYFLVSDTNTLNRQERTTTDQIRNTITDEIIALVSEGSPQAAFVAKANAEFLSELLTSTGESDQDV